MGTRNLTVVFMDGEYRVAQYGQWDGYPEGHGMTCLLFLREKMNEAKFREALKNHKWITPEEYEARLDDIVNGRPFFNPDDSKVLKVRYPEFHRDTGAEILELIQNGGTTTKLLKNDITFAADGTFCEWAWVIDLDKRTFEAYEGFRHEPTTDKDRFYFLREHEEGSYTCVKKVAEWSIDNLPTKEEFLKAFEQDGEQE